MLICVPPLLCWNKKLKYPRLKCLSNKVYRTKAWITDIETSISKLIKWTKNNYCKQLFEKYQSGSQITRKTVKDIYDGNSFSQIKCIQTHEGQQAVDPKAIASESNRFFSTVGMKLQTGRKNHCQIDSTTISGKPQALTIYFQLQKTRY